MPKNKRSLLAQFRSGTLPLRIETGRFRKIMTDGSNKTRQLRTEERICEICDLKETEDETHFLCKCPMYTTTRNRLVDRIVPDIPAFKQLNIDEQFVILLNRLNKEVASYLLKAWQIRKHILYRQ